MTMTKKALFNASIGSLMIASVGLTSFDAHALTSTEMEAGCLTDVAMATDDAREEAINRHLLLAEGAFSEMTETFSDMSCLENLLDGGMDIFFSPPSLGSLLNKLKNAVCRKAKSMLNEAVAPLNRAANASLNVGEIAPGINLGSVNGGLKTRFKGNGDNQVKTNIGSVLSGGSKSKRDVIFDAAEVGNGIYDDIPRYEFNPNAQ
ncbi:hypothetical protein [Thalassospira xiamenensis]|uniref:Uncharacterized protein n=1 Tax=Thalassospira xiamenensis TaxID=220697 RepID=A0A285TXG4_9PROT|nr:hypothetical protein [Thalassospira xiamenensis]SOC30436.1 hypothetical protein SAMN05428964_10943 [Thalassospira xiamenensis]